MITIPVSEHILLRTFDEKDVNPFYEIIKQERDYLRPWISWIDRIQTRIDVLDFIEQGHQKIRDQQALPMLIVAGDTILGGIGMHSWNHELRLAKIGYWLRASAQGKGLMMQAAYAFLKYLFKEVGLHKVELEYFPENTKSAALAKRLGFTVEAHLRDAMKYHGRYHNLVVCGMLENEFK